MQNSTFIAVDSFVSLNFTISLSYTRNKIVVSSFKIMCKTNLKPYPFPFAYFHFVPFLSFFFCNLRFEAAKDAQHEIQKIYSYFNWMPVSKRHTLFHIFDMILILCSSIADIFAIQNENNSTFMLYVIT